MKAMIDASIDKITVEKSIEDWLRRSNLFRLKTNNSMF